MPKVHKTIQEAGKHLADSASVIGSRYKEATAKADWEAPSSSPEAEQNYQDGVSESIANGTRIAGIRAAGNAKYQKGCAEKGAAVIGQRVAAARVDYERNFTPVLQAMNTIEWVRGENLNPSEYALSAG